MLRFVQLSDPHLLEVDKVAKGVRPNARFARAIAQVQRMAPPPAFCIITGDLVGDETAAHYAQLKALCAPLTCPLHFCLGNHDDPAIFREVIGPGLGPAEGKYCYAFDLPNDEEVVRFIVLDSHLSGEVSGALGTSQLAWLAEQLQGPCGQAIVFVHHPAVPLGNDWMDTMRLSDGEVLLDTLRKGPVPVARVLFGHVHQPITLTSRGLTLTSAPSTGYQFTDEEVTSKVHAGTAGYLVVTVSTDTVVTTVVPIEMDTSTSAASEVRSDA